MAGRWELVLTGNGPLWGLVENCPLCSRLQDFYCHFQGRMMKKGTAITAGLLLATLVLCATVFARGASGQIAKVVDDAGRPFFVNAEPPLTAKLHASKPRINIYLPAESSFSGSNRPTMDIGRDGTEKLVREAADRHRVDPALVREVIETDSNWNPRPD